MRDAILLMKQLSSVVPGGRADATHDKIRESDNTSHPSFSGVAARCSSSPLVRRFYPGTMASPSRRRDADVMKLMMSDFKVELVNDAMHDFHVEFHGPKGCAYQDGVWRVHVELQESYPYKPPTINFTNRIFHPNIDEMSGAVCLDVIDQKWSPMFALINIFEVFLPQLLLYPNPGHPLNGEAAVLMNKDREKYEQKVKEHCQKYAKPENAGFLSGNESSDDESTDLSSDEEDMTE
ncbi:hypothetical protein R1sor_017053 [Riccia sorocarpa]|uniref:E2 ubiquitin-conjugating enzyme n=1 Tax=Riccia sorocarpa TaxID=122646 RepID=A0ABD3I6U8_9MARC